MGRSNLGVLAGALWMVLPVGAALSQSHAFGAIAWSQPTGSQGYAWSHGSREAAERRAVAECEKVSQRGDCRVMVWFRNACGALAEAQDGAVGTGWGVTRTRAESEAMAVCRRYGSGCRLRRTVCANDP